MSKDTLKTCSKGHRFYKSSDCPTCPICEGERKPTTGFLSLLPAPARRGLESAGLDSLVKVSEWSETDIAKLHGMGPKGISILKKLLTDSGLAFAR
ncbi:MAG TPA: hypothetical protein VGD40_13120 [Chryseosolibacter sp.]